MQKSSKPCVSVYFLQNFDYILLEHPSTVRLKVWSTQYSEV